MSIEPSYQAIINSGFYWSMIGRFNDVLHENIISDAEFP